jgi:hypothetical protein
MGWRRFTAPNQPTVGSQPEPVEQPLHLLRLPLAAARSPDAAVVECLGKSRLPGQRRPDLAQALGMGVGSLGACVSTSLKVAEMR